MYWSRILKKYRHAKRDDAGLTLVELMIGLFITVLISMAVVQLFRLGFNSIKNNSLSASRNGFESSLEGYFGRDMAQSQGFIVSSGTSKTTKADLCTTWQTGADFTQTKPLVTISLQHATTVNKATVDSTGTKVSYTTNSKPDFKVGQVVSISGLGSNLGLDFNLSNATITEIATNPASFSVAKPTTSTLTAGNTSDPTTLSTTVTSMSNGLITVADATGISDGMSVTWSGASFDSTKNYLTTAIDPVAGTVQLNPTPTSNIAASTTLNFISNSNGTAISHSYVGYEIRNTSTAESSTQTAELWRVQCESAGQTKPDSNASVRLRTTLPVIDTASTHVWDGAITCPQFDATLLGSAYISHTDTCPTDTYVSVSQDSFLTSIGNGGASTSSTLFLENGNNSSSGVSPGMSVEYDGLSSASYREYITAVDLTDPSGDAKITIACVNASLSAQSVVTCPAPPSIGTRVVIGSSIYATCATTGCGILSSNTVVLADISLLHQGMYTQFSNQNFAVISDIGGLGSQQIVLSVSTGTLPDVMEFFRPVALKFSVPATISSPIIPAQVLIAGHQA